MLGAAKLHRREKAKLIKAAETRAHPKRPIFWFPPKSNAGGDELCATALAHRPQRERTRFRALTSKSSETASLNMSLQRNSEESKRNTF
jgi:hypothetical protein